jgi:enamine deaminase RidA (YjgF/YER057c/UK114 family)
MRCLAGLICLALAWTLTAQAAEKKKKGKKGQEEEITQVLELPRDPPAVAVAEAERLAFQVTPLYSKGLLSQQVREALRWLLRQDRPVVRLRAFVAGTGDTRRVQAIVSEEFTERRLPLPTLTVIQVGALPQEGAQVVLEALAADRKPVNPKGLVFVAGQAFSVDAPLEPVAPLAEKALDHVRRALSWAGAGPGDVLAVTCYLTSLADVEKVRATASRQFPQAALNLLQPLRGALHTSAACEAAGRLSSAPREQLETLDAPAPAGGARHSAAVLIGPGRLAITGAQLAFGTGEADARLAFQRLEKALEAMPGFRRGAAVVHIYPLSRAAADLAQRVGAEYFDEAKPPAITALPIEGLPSMDASFSFDLIAVVPEIK